MSDEVLRGRPTTLTPELQRKLCASVRACVPMATASAAAGISYDTVRAWLKRGKREETGIYADFLVAFTRAKAIAEKRLVKTVLTAGPEDWKAAAWLLERRHPDRYGKTTKTELSGPKGGAIQVTGPTIMIPPESDD